MITSLLNYMRTQMTTFFNLCSNITFNTSLGSFNLFQVLIAFFMTFITFGFIFGWFYRRPN